MPALVLYPAFPDEFALSNYPFTDRSTRLSDGGIELPRGLIVDAALHPIGFSGVLSLTSVVVTPESTTVWFGTEDDTDIASAEIRTASASDQLAVLDTLGRPAGLLVGESGSLAGFTAFPLGTHVFSDGAAELVPSVVLPSPEVGVRGLRLADGQVLTGPVWLVGEDGIVIREVSPGVIRIDAVGDPLFVRKLCEPAGAFASSRFVRTINDCPPDEFGNVQINFGNLLHRQTVVRVYPTQTGLEFGAAGPGL